MLDGLRALPGVEDAFVNTKLPVAAAPAAATVALRHQTTERDRQQNPGRRRDAGEIAADPGFELELATVELQRAALV